MKFLYLFAIIVVIVSCKEPNNAASTRVSTVPMSNDPSTTLPGTGASAPYSQQLAADHDSSMASKLASDSIPKVSRDSAVKH